MTQDRPERSAGFRDTPQFTVTDHVETDEYGLPINLASPEDTLYDELLDLAVTPNGRPGDASPLARPGYKGPRRTSDYERMIAHALMRKGKSKSRAIAMARGLLNKAAKTGRWGDKGKASAKTRAGAVANEAQRRTF